MTPPSPTHALAADASPAEPRPVATSGAPLTRAGKAGYVLLWLLGVPIPVLLLIYRLRGCT
jgi:hypothetical protein